MVEDLTTSQRERQNILNNRYAVIKVEEHLAVGGVDYQGERIFTKRQVAELFAVSDSTIERYLASHEEELKRNGYVLARGRNLKEFKGLVDVTLIGEGNKAPVLCLIVCLIGSDSRKQG